MQESRGGIVAISGWYEPEPALKPKYALIGQSDPCDPGSRVQCLRAMMPSEGGVVTFR